MAQESRRSRSGGPARGGGRLLKAAVDSTSQIADRAHHAESDEQRPEDSKQVQHSKLKGCPPVVQLPYRPTASGPRPALILPARVRGQDRREEGGAAGHLLEGRRTRGSLVPDGT